MFPKGAFVRGKFIGSAGAANLQANHRHAKSVFKLVVMRLNNSELTHQYWIVNLT
jgi:hypothetical protein